MKLSKRTNQKGFTLVELAIVLVIIGLIVGGVLAGQDLIKAATVKAAVTQMNQLDTAANTFRNKYAGLPGDLSSAASFAELAPYSTGQGTTKGLGDNNGLIESSGTTGLIGYQGEPALFETHLAKAGLIANPITATTTYVAGTAAITISDTTMIPSKMGKGTRLYAVAYNGVNYYTLAGISGTSVVTTAAWSAAATNTLSPTEAFQLDTKLDDGQPTSGSVQPIKVLAAAASIQAIGDGAGAPTDAGAAASAAGVCWNTTTNKYATDVTAATNAPACQLRVRASF